MAKCSYLAVVASETFAKMLLDVADVEQLKIAVADVDATSCS